MSTFFVTEIWRSSEASSRLFKIVIWLNRILPGSPSSSGAFAEWNLSSKNVDHFADRVLVDLRTYVRSAGAKRSYIKLSYTHVDITCLADVMRKFIQPQLRGCQSDKERNI